MYDKALEQLIDAVIADGVITDHERKVVYKKAATLGIDQDEIEVYLEGRLDAFNKTNQSQSGKRGTVKTCPNCGANLGSFMAVCPECGHEISDISGNSAVKDLMDKLDKIDRNKPKKTGGFLNGNDPEQEVEDKKAEVISLFPVPNTKNDLIEFATLCRSGLKSTSEDSVIYDAWRGKASQIVDKAKILFPNDSNVEIAIKGLSKERNNFFKNHSGIISSAVIFAILGIVALILVFHHNSQQEYASSRIEMISELPTPTISNYQDCFRKFNAITWTKPKKDNGWEDVYPAFQEAQNAYKELLIMAYKEAGISYIDLPPSLQEMTRHSVYESLGKKQRTTDNGANNSASRIESQDDFKKIQDEMEAEIERAQEELEEELDFND